MADSGNPKGRDTKPRDFDAMVAECKRRGYDPDMMLGIARMLPKLSFRKNKWGTICPVLRKRYIGRTHLWRPNNEVM